VRLDPPGGLKLRPVDPRLGDAEVAAELGRRRVRRQHAPTFARLAICAMLGSPKTGGGRARVGKPSSRVCDLRLDSAARNAALAIKDAGGGIAMARFLRRLMDHYDDAPPGADGSGGLAPLEYDSDSPSRQRRRTGR
jgi:hypothetical protein